MHPLARVTMEMQQIIGMVWGVKAAEASLGKLTKNSETYFRIENVKVGGSLTPKQHSKKVDIRNSDATNVANYQKLKDDLYKQNLDNIAKQDLRLDAAVKGGNGKVNFGIGVGTTAEADRLGKIWVGDGAKLVGDQKGCPGCLVSADGLRIYRPPTYKPNTPKNLNPTGVQANFVQLEKGKVVSNGHMGIEK